MNIACAIWCPDKVREGEKRDGKKQKERSLLKRSEGRAVYRKREPEYTTKTIKKVSGGSRSGGKKNCHS